MYLVDTNIIIYYLDNQKQAVEFIQRHYSVIDNPLYVSIITVIEVLSFKFSSKEQEQIVREFLQDNFVWLTIDNNIIDKTANIRQNKKMKTPDAIIGATALVHNLAIVTRNAKDFQHLSMEVINPM